MKDIRTELQNRYNELVEMLYSYPDTNGFDRDCYAATVVRKLDEFIEMGSAQEEILLSLVEGHFDDPM